MKTTATETTKRAVMKHLAGLDRDGRYLVVDLWESFDMPKADLDAILRQAQDDGLIQLFPLDNPRERTARVMAGAVDVSGVLRPAFWRK